MDIVTFSDDIQVILSVSKNSVEILDQENSTLFKVLNIPVCVSEFCLNIEGEGSERLRQRFSIICRDMAKIVFVDSTKRYVFIGREPEDENTALISYYVKTSGGFEEQFFRRWEETRMLLLEFQVFDRSRRDLFALKGVWLKEEWHSLEVVAISRIEVIESEGKN
jgi:hypothetical protein